jgi:hypothetical protein
VQAHDWEQGLFESIAAPRIAGSERLREVEGVISQRLTQSGYSVQFQRFRASPRALAAVSLFGAASGWTALILGPFLIIELRGWPVLLTGLGAIALAVLLAGGVAAGVIPYNGLEVETVNMWAGRGGITRFWLVAHSDSKSQGLSLAGRVLVLMTLGLGLTSMILALAFRTFVPLPWWAAAPPVFLTVLAGAALSRGVFSNDSPGAVDNATGVIAVLVAAERLANRDDVGVLITSAEEFGMVGARVWVAGGHAQGDFINFDGLDSCGEYRITRHGRRGSPARQRAEQIAEVMGRELIGAGGTLSRLGLPAAVLVDGKILEEGGMRGVTVSRGRWSTLQVVHTRADSAGRVDIGSAVAAGTCAARAVESLLS